LLQSHTLTHAQILRSSLPCPISADRGQQHCWRQYPVGVTVSSEVPRLRFRLDLPIGDDGLNFQILGLDFICHYKLLIDPPSSRFLVAREDPNAACRRPNYYWQWWQGGPLPPLRAREAANSVHLCIPSTDPFGVETCAGQPCINRPGPQSLASTT
jgi:hypothetical protein